MKKVLTLLLTIMALGFCCPSEAKTKGLNKDFTAVINNSGVEKNSIAISIKNLDTGKPVYEHNEKILMHPASIQKILTIVPDMEVLGKDYEFSTKIYSRGDDSFIIQLGADPYLTSADLKKLVNHINLETKKVYVDDTILEKKDWGEGWQWDDDLNVLMPRFNSYNLDKNLLKITVMPAEKGKPAFIINPSKYPIVFFNHVVTGNENNVKISRDNSVSANTLILEGTVNKPLTLYVPVNNLKRYFDIKLTGALADKRIYLKQNILNTKVSSTDKQLDKITHPITDAVTDILKNSNNTISETVSKLAGAKAYNDIGTDINGIKVFNAYCEKNGLDNSRIRLTDASGVSKNNLITADFMTDFLVKNKNNEILQNLPTPGEGTLTHRMLPIKNNLHAKTGTHCDISSIAGFLTAKSGHKYAFCIIINDPNSTRSDLKTLEDYLIREAYLRG